MNVFISLQLIGSLHEHNQYCNIFQNSLPLWCGCADKSRPIQKIPSTPILLQKQMINVFAGCFPHPNSWWSCRLVLQNDIYHPLNNCFVLIFVFYFVLTFLKTEYVPFCIAKYGTFSIFLMSEHNMEET